MIEMSQILMVNRLSVKELGVNGFVAWTLLTLTSNSGTMVDYREFSKMPNWKHYWMNSFVQVIKSLHDQKEWCQELFQNFLVTGMIQEHGKLVTYELKLRDVNLQLFVCEIWFKGKNVTVLCLATWLGTRYGFSTVVLSRRNHRNSLGTHPHRAPYQKSNLQVHAWPLVGPAWHSLLRVVGSEWKIKWDHSWADLWLLRQAVRDRRYPFPVHYDKVSLNHDNAGLNVAKVIRLTWKRWNAKY